MSNGAAAAAAGEAPAPTGQTIVVTTPAGGIPEFGEHQDWEDWIDRLSFHLEAHRVTDDSLKRATLLSSCGTAIVGLAKSLVAPDNIRTISYNQLVERLTEHFAPQPTQMARRMAFYDRTRRSQESATEFLAALRRLANKCEFSNLDEALRDQFTRGQTDTKLMRKLVATKDLNLAKAMELAAAADQGPRGEPRQRSQPSSRSAAIHHEDYKDDTDSEDEAVHRTQRGENRRTRTTGPSRKRSPERPERHRIPCGSCGEDHVRRNCRFRDAKCRNCGKTGHIARACRSGPPQEDHSGARPRQTATLNRDTDHTSRSHQQVLHIPSGGPDRIMVNVLIEGKPCSMHLDTGSPVSIISAKTLQYLCPRRAPYLRPTPFGLQDFQKNSIALKGVGTFRVQFKGRTAHLDLFITEGPYTSLLGMEWFEPLGIRVTGIHQTAAVTTGVDNICQEFPSVFDGSLGLYKGPPVTLQLDPAVRPIRLRARRVPFALKPKIDEELDRLIEQGVLEPVPHGPWETPIVTPVKPNGSVRICADYKCTLNKALQDHAYPVPVVSHVLSTLAGAKVFGKLDLAQAYQQLPVDAATADAQTIVTHRGAFRVKRLQFGVSVAPGIFQNLMDTLLKGIPGVTPFFDDVLIAAPSEEEFTGRLRQVLRKFQEAGLKVKREKCLLGVPRVDFLGFSVDADGIHPAPEKVRAIQNAPAPNNKTELQAFLGLLNFYHAFLPHKAAIAEPLHRLLDKRSPWVWGSRQRTAFQDVKDLLVSNEVLAHFDETLPVILACDASPYGVGAVLGHKLPDGREVPVAYFSQTLTPAERNYAQIDKEGLAIVKGVKKFHDYLYGRSFTILTDHKPLLGLFAPDRQTPQVLSPRVLRWSIFLAGYQYALEYRKGKAMGHADALSRLPLPENGADPAPAHLIMSLTELPEPPLHAKDIAKATSKDRTLARVLDWVWRGWPTDKMGPEFTSYVSRKDELSAHKGCLLWGSRVIIPPPLRKKVMNALHEAHPGVVRMKALARSYVWWPGLDKEIEEWVQRCPPCQESRPSPPRAPGQTWEETRKPWSRLHLDFAGPFQGQTFLIVVDSHSKWLEVVPVSTTSTLVTIRALRKLFATHGLPDTLVTDNGTAFTSTEFSEFTEKYGLRHIRSAPFHPATNGQAERMVRTAKDGLRRLGDGDWSYKLARFLLAQHTTPCTATGRSPAELLMGRKLTTLLDRLHPDRAVEQQPRTTEREAPRGFFPGDPVFAENHGSGPAWIPARVTRVMGPTSYEVSTDGGQLWRRHIDQLRRRVLPTEEAAPAEEDAPEEDPTTSPEQTEAPAPLSEEPATVEAPQEVPDAEIPRETQAETDNQQPATPTVPAPTLNTPDSNTTPRRSQRERQRPAYLRDYVCRAHSDYGGRSVMYW